MLHQYKKVLCDLGKRRDSNQTAQMHSLISLPNLCEQSVERGKVHSDRLEGMILDFTTRPVVSCKFLHEATHIWIARIQCRAESI